MIVEGIDTAHFVPELMENYIGRWETGPDQYLVNIDSPGGQDDILNDAYMYAKLRSPEVSYLGLVLDAEGDLSSLWIRISSLFATYGFGLDDHPPSKGYIGKSESINKKLGIWIFPDNQTNGMLEDFIILLLSDQSHSLFDFAKDATEKAKSDKNAPFKEVHRSKAEVRNWLAWQDPPGIQYHHAELCKSVLNLRASTGLAFRDWFMELFDF
ncbi:hypothetical protein GF324_11320 [bacterium]|nr:hypothetical protein [bacterium]